MFGSIDPNNVTQTVWHPHCDKDNVTHSDTSTLWQKQCVTKHMEKGMCFGRLPKLKCLCAFVWSFACSIYNAYALDMLQHPKLWVLVCALGGILPDFATCCCKHLLSNQMLAILHVQHFNVNQISPKPLSSLTQIALKLTQTSQRTQQNCKPHKLSQFLYRIVNVTSCNLTHNFLKLTSTLNLSNFL